MKDQFKLEDDYFKKSSIEKSKADYRDIDTLVGADPDEQILWRGKPKRSAFILARVFRMLPIALIWLAIDGFFIGFITYGIIKGQVPTLMILFFVLFFALHLTPVWVWLGNIITASAQLKNIEYAFTNKRIIIRSGIIVDFKNVYYSDIQSVDLKVGLIDRILKVGDIYITTTGRLNSRIDLEDISDPYFITQRLQKIVLDIKADINFPNNLRPEGNDGFKTKYRG